MSKSYPFLIIVCVAQLAGLSWGQSCYTPGGSLSSTHFPCYPDASTSLCCPMGWTCFSSNLCMVTDTSAVDSQFPVGTAQRGGCTNENGDNDLCGDYCLGSDSDSMISCGNNRFCCGSEAAQGSCSCDTGEGTFAAEGGIAKTIMGEEGMEKTATTLESTATSGLTVSTSTTLSTSTTGSSTSTASKTLETASRSATNSGAENTSSSTETSSPSSIPFTQKTGFKVMIAIVVVAAVAILAAGAFLLWRRRKQRRGDTYEHGPFPDDSSSMHDLSTVPLPPSHSTRPDPDPYAPPIGSPRIGSPIERRETRVTIERDPFTPPVDDPYRRPFPMASITPRPYEGT